ncbi:MAG: cardiolipin synthase B, partial [Gemmatimonadota bacterium]|nr:cardiolipin synthase B [Gemmatimonadota bacterium]
MPASESSTIGPRFARGLWRIAAADASSGNEVELMRDGTRIFDAMIDIITQARATVVLESYLVVSDSVGERFSVALIAAVARGVKVRMIADWAGSRGAKRAYWRELRESGVDVRIFNKPG